MTVGSEAGDLKPSLAAVGLKINPVGLLFVFNALIAIGDGGPQDDITPLFGIDYTF